MNRRHGMSAEKSRTYYLSGPMSGIPQFNFPMFDRIARSLRAQGYRVVSPAEMDDEAVRAAAVSSADGAAHSAGGPTWGDFLARDVRIIADQVNGIILLPGWERSRGARLEAFVALLQKDFDFLRWDDQVAHPVQVSRRTVQSEIHVAWGL